VRPGSVFREDGGCYDGENTKCSGDISESSQLSWDEVMGHT
jgi:hypothetical protein